MVLTARGAGGAGAPRASRLHRTLGRADPGSQTLEFAMVLPAVVLVLVLLVHAALVGADLVVAHGLAREAARAAALDDDAAARRAVSDAAPSRSVRVLVDPPDHRRVTGDQVHVEVRLRSRAFRAFGVDVWLPARAAMRTEEDA